MRHALPWFVCALAFVEPAHAQEDDPELEHQLDELDELQGREPAVADLVPRPLAPTAAASGPSVSLALSTRQLERAVGGSRSDYAGSLVVTLPTDLFWSARKAKQEPADDIGGRSPPPGAAPSGAVRARPRPDASTSPLIRPRDARAAVAAAVRAAGHDRESEALDDLATRARWSAVLPQVRLRATRLIDESTSLSPTSYDANRTTESGGASLWLEARTTWSLDRLVYADDEVRIERLQRQVSHDAADLRADVLDHLFGWQRASVQMRDPTLPYHQCIERWLAAAEHEVTLDVLTAGWFTRWRTKRGIVRIDCDTIEVD